MGIDQSAAKRGLSSWSSPNACGTTQTATTTNVQNFQSNTTNSQWKVTTFDGFGHAIQVDAGHDAVNLSDTVSRTVSEFAPAACAPLMMLSQVSMEYSPQGNSSIPPTFYSNPPNSLTGWTAYTYDGSGRTIQVVAQDGNSSSTVTDAAGKWKMNTSDAFGNLTVVTEPSAEGGSNWTSTYTYDPLNRLIQVSMPRPEGTQTRSFSYTNTSGHVTADLLSATNPENVCGGGD